MNDQKEKNMSRNTKYLIIWLLAFACISTAHAQKATELYIPIGKSPGVSGETSIVGTIEAVDLANRTITVLYDNERYTGKLNVASLVYLDRSNYQKKNTRGTLEDCTVGSKCEMTYQYKEEEQTDFVNWLKVKVE